MKIVTTVAEVRKTLHALPSSYTIGFVPTMGYLHLGHRSLIQRAKEECDYVVLSIFVNPIQFGENEDYEQYPRDINRDTRIAENEGVDLLFHPSVEEMYPNPLLTTVQVEKITDRLCGKSRPGHFTGVATVVTKLFHIVMPDRAYFGLKDAQQLAVIEQMVRDLHFPVTIVPCEIVREKDGLAMSSRNVYLSAEERKQATILYQALTEVKTKAFRTAAEINTFVREKIETQPLAKIEYVETLAYPSLEPIQEIKKQQVIVAVAVRFGSTRLIDNVLLNEQEDVFHVSNHDEVKVTSGNCDGS